MGIVVVLALRMELLFLVGLQLPLLSCLAFQPLRINGSDQATGAASHRGQAFRTHASKSKNSKSSSTSKTDHKTDHKTVKNKTQKTTGSGRGGTRKGIGFGATKAAADDAADADFAVFPALEEEVRSTLIPVGEGEGGGSFLINDEVYDRLEQIYGFPSFNRPSTLSSSASTSLGDLLSAVGVGTGTGTNSSLQQTVGILPRFESVRVLHMDPLVLVVDHFFSDEECDRYISMSLEDTTVQTRSPTVGKDSLAKAQRTSTTFYHMYDRVPELLAKASRLLGIEFDQLDCLEEVQTVRYQRNQRFTWHLDALGPADRDQSGQRVATLLVYLTDLVDQDGGATLFRDLNLAVRPTKGTALLFFPAAGGIPGTPMDIRTLHCGEVVRGDTSHDSTGKDKWIAQVWLREKTYRPTVPPGNAHVHAVKAVEEYCNNALSR